MAAAMINPVGKASLTLHVVLRGPVSRRFASTGTTPAEKKKPFAKLKLKPGAHVPYSVTGGRDTQPASGVQVPRPNTPGAPPFSKPAGIAGRPVKPVVKPIAATPPLKPNDRSAPAKGKSIPTTTAPPGKVQATIRPYQPPSRRTASNLPRIHVPYDRIVQFDSHGQLAVFAHNGKFIEHINPDEGKVYIDRPGDTEFFHLSDGRTLCYSLLGSRSSKGPAFVSLHGTPGSRLGTPGGWVENSIVNKGMREIRIDRPGYGHTTASRRSHMQFAADVEELLNALGIDKFYLTGTSGGGPFALACAHHFPRNRVISTGIMCSTAPNSAGWAHNIPWLWFWGKMLQRFSPKLFWWSESIGRAELKRVSHHNRQGWAIPDDHPNRWEELKEAEEHRQGKKGHTTDLEVNRSNWEFDLGTMDANPIYVYHGTADQNTPIHEGEWIRDQLPPKTVHWRPFHEEDHSSLQRKYIWRMLKEMLRHKA